LSQLDLMTSDIEQRSSLSIPGPSRIWQSVSDVSWALPKSSPGLFTLRTRRGQLIAHLVDARSGEEIWRKSLGRDRLLQQPTAHLIDQTQAQSMSEKRASGVIGVLMGKRFVILSLIDGSIIRSERLSLRGRLKSALLSAALEKSVSWDLRGGNLTVLHPLHRRLYMSTGDQPLRKRSLAFKRLSPRASLQTLHDQWVVTSPDFGEVFGVTPQGDRVAWTWRRDPFISLKLGPRWALFHHANMTQLSSVFPLSSDELSRQAPSEQTSLCAAGDRWECMISGDELIGIDPQLDLKRRPALIRSWFEDQRDQISYSRRVNSHLTGPPSPSIPKPLDALQAQSQWSSACQWGIAEACTRLGMLAELGLTSKQLDIPPTGIPSLRQAFKYYQRADRIGDPLASERLGEMNEKGLGTAQNYQRARVAYFKACESSLQLPHSCAQWGRLNELGLGGPIRLVTARTAYHRACQADVEWACQRLKHK
jgi:hypothetical protein